MNNQMNEYQYPVIIGGSGGQDFKDVTTTTRKYTKRIPASREAEIAKVYGMTEALKSEIDKYNTLADALGRSVSDQQVADALKAPTNKGRLESKMGWGQALSGALLSGLNTYGKLSKAKEDKARQEYNDDLKTLMLAEKYKTRQEDMDLQNEVNNQTVTVTGMEKYNLPKDGSGSNGGIQSLRPLDPTLGDRIRENPDAFGPMARIADRDTNGDLGKMITSSIAKGWQGDENLATRGQLIQEVTAVNGAITALQRASGAAASMMNSDKDAERMFGVLNHPQEYSSEELAAAVDWATRMYDNALRFSGKYEQVYGVKPGEEKSFPTGAQTTIPVAQQKVNYAGTQTNGGYAW